MKSVPRSLAVLTLAVALSPWALAGAGCGTDAIGVDACKTIEEARCKLAPKCYGDGKSPKIKTQDQVDNCVTYYKDHCLVGIENVKKEPSEATATACVNALKATIACKTGGKTDMASCDGAHVDNPSLTPCEVFTAPEHLDECRFVETPSDATTATTTGTTGGAGGDGGAGGGITGGGLAVTSGG